MNDLQARSAGIEPTRQLEVGRTRAQVAQLNAVGLGGRAELTIVAEQGVQARLEVEAGVDRLEQQRAPVRVELPAGGATPIRRQVAPRSTASASEATIGTGLRQNGTTSAAVRPACSESITATTSRRP